MTVAFGVVGLWPLLKEGHPRTWSLALAITFAVCALLAPQVLTPLNRLWMAFGRLLHKIVSPVILGLLFLVAVVPTGLILRLTGKDPLRLKFDRQAPSYWQPRTPPGPAPGSLKQQF
jgi:hypothetical protein